MDSPDRGSDVREEVPGWDPVEDLGVPRPGLRAQVGRIVPGVVGGGLGIAAFVAVGITLLSGLTFEGCELDFSDVGDPGTGQRSQRLDVDVGPTTGLDDGATVLVGSSAFRPHGIVGLAVCLEEAVTGPRGVAACDADGGRRVAVDDRGELATTFAVPRVITVDDEAHDCASSPGRCLLVAADSDDFDVSGGQELTFAPDLPPVDLVARPGPRPRTLLLPGAIEPTGPVTAGDTVTVTASGFEPGEPVLVGQCTETFLEADPWEVCEPIGPSETEAVVAIMTRTLDDVSTRADAAGTIRLTVPVSAHVTASYPFPDEDDPGEPCTERPGRCAIVVAAAADTQRSAYVPLTVTP